MPNLRVSSQQALTILKTIPHNTCKDAIDNHWIVDNKGHVKPQSVCWLFCWGKTGMNSKRAQEASQQAFNDILNISFDEFDARVSHEWARWARYSEDDLEDQLSS
jgi:hypothetical protein